MEETLERLPFTPTGVTVIGALLFIIGYLFRLINNQRNAEQTRISALEADYALRLQREREDRDLMLTKERENADRLDTFYQSRLDRVSERYEREVQDLRKEVMDMRQQLVDLRMTVDDERRRRREAEAQLAKLQGPVRRAGP